MRAILFILMAFFVVITGGAGISLYRAAVGVPGAPLASLGQADEVLAGNVNPATLPKLAASAPTDSREAVGRAVASFLKGTVEGKQK